MGQRQDWRNSFQEYLIDFWIFKSENKIDFGPQFFSCFWTYRRKKKLGGVYRCDSCIRLATCCALKLFLMKVELTVYTVVELNLTICNTRPIILTPFTYCVEQQKCTIVMLKETIGNSHK